MKRLAVVGVEIIHKFIYPGYLNGFDPDLMERYGGWMASLFRGKDPHPMDTEVRVTAIASPDRQSRDQIACTTHIDTVAEYVRDLPLDDLDGALIMEGQGWRHLELARPFLERGQFVYFDKPVVESHADWKAVRALIDTQGGRVLGGSALRYSPLAAAMLTELQARPPVSVVVTGPGPWYTYACHTVELLEMIFGPRVETARGIGSDAQGLAVMEWSEGQRGIVQWGSYRGEFRVDAYDREENGHRSWIINDAQDYYKNLARAIVDGALGRRHADLEAIEAIVRVLDEVGRSLARS